METAGKYVLICPNCRTAAVSEAKEPRCPNCDHTVVNSGILYEEWQTMSNEEKESKKAAIAAGGGEPVGVKNSAASSSRRTSRLFWLGILRGWAKFMIVVGVIGAIAAGILVGEYCWYVLDFDSEALSFIVGLLAAAVSLGASVLIPAGLMALANMAEDIGDMRDKKMQEKTES